MYIAVCVRLHTYYLPLHIIILYLYVYVGIFQLKIAPPSVIKSFHRLLKDGLEEIVLK